MSIGFFVTVNRSGVNQKRIGSVFVAHTLWGRDGEKREIDLQGRNWRIVCLGNGGAGDSKLWREGESADFAGSFVLLIGWCYRISSSSDSLSPDDYRQTVDRFRADKPPLSDDFGGQFVAVVYDAKRQRLAVQPDRLAQGTAFFAFANGEFAASNRALRLANYFSSALDGHSVLAQMRGTQMPFGRTLFAGVRRLMGATYLEFDLGQGHAEVRKPYSLFVPPQKISYADSVEVVTETVRRTVRRLLAASPVRFDLTGGNDTRVIASAVENITRGNGSHSFGFRVADPESSPDVRVARRVVECCGWPLVRLDRGPVIQASPEELALSATTADGNFPLHHIWDRVASERAYAEQTGPKKWKTHVGSPAGEVFRGYFYAQQMLSLGRSSNVDYDAILAYRSYASRGVDLRIFGVTAPTFEAHDEALLAPYRAIGDEGGSLPNPYKLDIMYLQRHCYRAGNTYSWLSNFLHVCLPFLSWELAGLALSLPWKYRANRGLMQRVIGRLSPKLASIPNEDGEPMKPLSLATFPAYLTAEIPIGIDYAKRVIRRLLGRSGGTTTSRTPVPEPTYFSVLDGAKKIPAVFDPVFIAQVRTQAGAGQNSRDCCSIFYVLCTIELLLREAPALQHRVIFD